MKKLKAQYKYQTVVTSQYRTWIRYPLLQSDPLKKFSTRQEKSYYFLHRIEYKEYSIKLRPSRGSCLANPWDDYSSGCHDTAKSWKHNSRRRHQHYRETSFVDEAS